MAESPSVIVSPESDRVQRNYRSLIVAATAVFAIGCSGCRGKPATPTVGPATASATVVRVNCPAGAAHALMERYGKAWAAIRRMKVEFAEEAHADLIIFTPAEMGRLVEADRIEPLPQAIVASDQWTGLMRQQRDKLALWGGKPFGLPLLADATVLIYRADLFADAKQQPPKDWAQLQDQVRLWATRRNGICWPPLPADEDGLDREFFTLAAAFDVQPVAENDLRKKAGQESVDPAVFAFHRRVDDASPRLEERGFGKALRVLQFLQPYRSKAPTIVEAFRREEAVMGLATLSDLAALQKAGRGRYAVAVVPAGERDEPVPYVGPGGALGAVSKSSQSREAALDLLQYVAGQANEYIHQADIGSAPFRAAHLAERREGWFAYQLDEGGTQRLLDALRVAVDPRAINAPIRLRTPDQAEYRRLLLTKVREAAEKATDADKTLTEAANAWKQRDASVPPEKLIADYKRSLGLK